MEDSIDKIIQLKKDKNKVLKDMLINNKKLSKLVDGEDLELTEKNIELDKHYTRIIDNVDYKIQYLLNDKQSKIENKTIRELDNKIKDTLLKIQKITEENTQKINEEMESSKLKFKDVNKSVKALKIYNQNSRV